MEFAKDYFEDEVRNGFYIPGIMKRCWAASIEVMGEIYRSEATWRVYPMG